MSAQHELTPEEIDNLLNLVREHWPDVFDYEEGIANKALNASTWCFNGAAPVRARIARLIT